MNNQACVVFNVDDDYLPGFKVLCYSLQKFNTFSGLGKIVLTTSESVASDSFTQRVADVRMIPESFLQELDEFTINYGGHPLPNQKENRERFVKVKRATFSKLYALSDFGYQKHIFLDADLLCLNNADYLWKECNEAAFYAAPALQKSHVTDADGNYYPAERASFLEETHFNATSHKGIGFNSGVFVANRPVLGAATVQELVKLGKAGDYSGDQPILTDFFRAGHFPYQNISPWFNVERPFYYVMGAQSYARHRPLIRFLHYTGMRKPWWPFEYSEPTVSGVDFIYREWKAMEAEAMPWIAALSGTAAR